MHEIPASLSPGAYVFDPQGFSTATLKEALVGHGGGHGTSEAVVLTLDPAGEMAGGLVRPQIAGPHPGFLLQAGQRPCIFNKFPGDVDAAGPGPRRRHCF